MQLHKELHWKNMLKVFLVAEAPISSFKKVAECKISERNHQTKHSTTQQKSIRKTTYLSGPLSSRR